MIWPLFALLGIVQMGLPYVLFARSLRAVSAQEAALVPLLEPVLNPLWVWIVWREQVQYSTWIGGSLILTGLLLRYTVFRTGPTGRPLLLPCEKSLRNGRQQ